MNGEVRVSICIPSYNAANYIGETIASVLSSTYHNVEIIVSDDASTDNTREAVQRFEDKRILFLGNGTRLGVPANRNRALRKASGEFVGLLNHDDLYGPFWLTFAIHILRKYTHIGWVATAFRIIDGEGTTLSIESRFPQTREYQPEEAFPCIARLDGLGPGFITRREVLEEVGYYDEDAGPGADNDFFLSLSSKYPLYYSAYPHTAWRLHADNLTHKWELVEQATEGFGTLNKIFGSEALPEGLGKLKESCYAYFSRKVLACTRKSLKNGDFKTARHLVQLLLIHGCWKGGDAIVK